MTERKTEFNDYVKQHPNGRDYMFSTQEITSEFLNMHEKHTEFLLKNVHKFVRFRK
jgi:hypothetical protein